MAVKNLRAYKIAKMNRKRAEKHRAHKEAEKRGRNGTFTSPWGDGGTVLAPPRL